MRKLFVSAIALLSISAVYAEEAPAAVDNNINIEKNSETKSTLNENDFAVSNGETASEPSQENNEQGVSLLSADTEKSTTDADISKIPTNLEKIEKTENQPAKSERKSKTLKLQKVESKEFFNNPNAFASLLRPGYWVTVPHKDGKGWTGSVLISQETLSSFINKNASQLAAILFKEDIDPGMRSGALQIIRLAMEKISAEDIQNVLHYLEISDIQSYDSILDELGLRKKFQSTIEDLGNRPHIGLNLNYSDGMAIDVAETSKTYETRIAMAKEIESHTNAIKKELEKRNGLIDKESQAKLEKVQSLADENKELEKKIEAEKSKHADEIAKAEADKKAGEDELATAEQMPETITVRSNRRRTTTQPNAARTSAINAAKEKISVAEEALKQLSSGYAEFEAKMKANNEEIEKREKDEDLAGVIAIERKFDKDIAVILEKIKECYMRLAYLDPSKISALALKAMKLSKDLKDKVSELNNLTKKNKEILDIIDANKEVVSDLEAKKKDLDEAKDELKTAEAMPAKIGSGRRAKTNTARTEAINAAQTKIDEAQKAYDEQMKKLPENYEQTRQEFDFNEAVIQNLKTTKGVMDAKKTLDAFEVEKLASNKAKSEKLEDSKKTPEAEKSAAPAA